VNYDTVKCNLFEPLNIIIVIVLRFGPFFLIIMGFIGQNKEVRFSSCVELVYR
jgi:hypothetical protein